MRREPLLKTKHSQTHSTLNHHRYAYHIELAKPLSTEEANLLTEQHLKPARDTNIFLLITL